MKHLEDIIKDLKKNNVNGEVNEEDLIKESVTISKSDLKRLGKELMKEVNSFLHNKYTISNFPEIILDREEFDRNVNRLKEKYESESLNIEEMYDIFNRIYLDEEIDGDLFFKKESYKNLFKVLSYGHSYLED